LGPGIAAMVHRSTKMGKDGFLNYICTGDGPPVVLVHGLASSLDNWQTLMPGLVAAGYRVYAVDLLGHGESHKPNGAQHYHIESIYSHFEEWIDRLHLETPPTLIGHSLGGYLSLTYAIQNPDSVRGCVLIDPFYSQNQLNGFLRLAQHRPELGEKTLRFIPYKAITALIDLLPAQSSISMENTHQTALDYRRASPQIFHPAHDSGSDPAPGGCPLPHPGHLGRKRPDPEPGLLPAPG
jgi:pimeloyl-ACP methyl ester carboxylesterase